MDEIKRSEFGWGVTLSLNSVEGTVTLRSIIRKETRGTVNWMAFGPVSPAEARAFAQRIIAVADAVEQELAKEIK